MANENTQTSGKLVEALGRWKRQNRKRSQDGIIHIIGMWLKSDSISIAKVKGNFACEQNPFLPFAEDEKAHSVPDHSENPGDQGCHTREPKLPLLHMLVTFGNWNCWIGLLLISWVEKLRLSCQQHRYCPWKKVSSYINTLDTLGVDVFWIPKSNFQQPITQDTTNWPKKSFAVMICFGKIP